MQMNGQRFLRVNTDAGDNITDIFKIPADNNIALTSMNNMNSTKYLS